MLINAIMRHTCTPGRPVWSIPAAASLHVHAPSPAVRHQLRHGKRWCVLVEHCWHGNNFSVLLKHISKNITKTAFQLKDDQPWTAHTHTLLGPVTLTLTPGVKINRNALEHRSWARKFKPGAFWLQNHWISQPKPTFLGAAS